MKVKPITTKRVYQEIIAQFIEMLCQNKIRPGDKLPPERELTEMFQVSRPSVREALRVLETIGLIRIHAGGGAYVTDLDMAPFLSMFAPLFTQHENFEMELLDLRELLEVKAVSLAAENPDTGKLAYLEEALKLMQEATTKDDLEQGAAGDIAFHTRIFEISDNYVLKKTSEFVNSLLEISIHNGRSLVLEKLETATQLYKDHRLIFEAVKNNDPYLAGKLMSDHIKMVKSIYETMI